MTTFAKEIDFENALVQHLTNHGWNEVLNHPSEDDLIKNWASIIYDNNREQTRLGSYPLTDSEMRQIITKVNLCSSPYEVNNFINGKLVNITRDNPADTHNCGKEVYLKIFDQKEICAGQSRYQIARQPQLRTTNPLAGDRRGDLMLLINGMPVIHVELKRTGVDVSQAVFQLKRYTHEGVFAHGIFSLVQVFVAMTPEETLYFANPGKEELFNPSNCFHWEDFNNKVVSEWDRVATDLISIPMAHQLIGYYTIADDKDKTLKVLRSYQFWAVSKISDKVQITNWDDHQHKGGFIWHTTGSGKTMTSFKAAQLISKSGDADKVVFLLDRIELSVQSLDEYRGFAGDDDNIQDTANTGILINKLKSNDNDDRLIVTSIQKMYNLTKSSDVSSDTLEEIGRKRLVFVIDECHRSVFGDMLVGIRNTFPRALLFGFTGTPIFEENAKDEIMTETIFGDNLHKYTIANAIPDGNVLGFDLYRVETYDEQELREKAAFRELGVQSIDEIADDEDKMKVYNNFMNEKEMPMSYMKDGNSVRGIESYLPKDLYTQDIHHQTVAQDIVDGFERISRNGTFHGILATKSIEEAIAYYRLFKAQYSSLNVVAVFEESIDNSDRGISKEDALLEMLADYNAKFGTAFQLSTYGKYKKDVAKRLAHKKPYIGIENEHNRQIDLLIVVTQMLTGYDSKWVNALYVDKTMQYANLIQAFSRTNRLFGPEKPFGIIKYYTFPFTMEQYIKDALEVYVDRPLGVFVDKLEVNLNNINALYNHIRSIFQSHEIHNFERLPDTREDRNMFAKDFIKMTHLLEAAKLQTFTWDKEEYEFQHEDGYTKVKMKLNENTYLILLQRYRELFEGGEGNGGDDNEFIYPVDTYIVETGTGTIDAEYINSKFQKFVKNLYTEGPAGDLTKAALMELHKAFASFSQKDQRVALLIIHDIQTGDLRLQVGKTIQDYIADYKVQELRNQVNILSEAIEIDANALLNIIDSDVNEQNLDEFGRFQNLKLTINNVKAKVFLEKVLGEIIQPFFVPMNMDSILRMFILDPEARERILMAYLNDDLTLTEAQVEEPVVEEPEIIEVEQPTPEYDYGKIKAQINSLLTSSLSGVLRHMRPMDIVVDSVFKVLETTSIDTLDGVEVFVKSAFETLYAKENATIVEKFVAFNLLVTKFEAYLKKLYYLIHKQEVQPQYEGEPVTWKNVIHGFSCLWGLKKDSRTAYQQLYSYLEMVKRWRNDESHISPTATEQELNAAVDVVVTLYFYATGRSLMDLEEAGYIFD